VGGVADSIARGAGVGKTLEVLAQARVGREEPTAEEAVAAIEAEGAMKRVSCRNEGRAERMRAMRVVKGKVVGNTVVLDREGVLPEGSAVNVVLREVGEEDEDEDGWDVSEEEWAEIDEALAQADRGEGVDAFEFLEALKREDRGAQ